MHCCSLTFKPEHRLPLVWACKQFDTWSLKAVVSHPDLLGYEMPHCRAVSNHAWEEILGSLESITVAEISFYITVGVMACVRLSVPQQNLALWWNLSRVEFCFTLEENKSNSNLQAKQTHKFCLGQSKLLGMTFNVTTRWKINPACKSSALNAVAWPRQL